MHSYRWRLTHEYRWATTSLGPLVDGLKGRKGERCRIFARSARVFTAPTYSLWQGFPAYGGPSNVGIEFADGSRFVVPFWAVRAVGP